MHNVGQTGSRLAAHKTYPKAGLCYYRARYYDPATGRFLNEDPWHFDGGINFYAYTGNRVTTLIDSFGNSA
jgi:RHS repeat-associated protein